MIVLGLNAFHADSAACLVRDGELVAAVEEERFLRIKHWAGYPERAIAYCLAEAGVMIEDVDVVAINSDNRAALWPRLAYLAANRPELSAIRARLSARAERASIPELLSRQFPRARCLPRVERVEHHLAHLYSAFAVSPFEEAVAVSIDGFGDFASAAWGVGRGDEVHVEGRVLFPHSLGIFYQALTQYLGFPAYGDEYKVMGLAPYGEPRWLDKLRQVARIDADGRFALNPSYFRHPREAIEFAWSTGSPEYGDLFTPALELLLGPRRREDEPIDERFRDIAASAQALYEEAFFALLNRLHRRHRLPRLALAGGCAMNSVANGKIRRQTPFAEVYVPPAPGDAGGAIGAALAAWRRGGGGRRFTMDHAFWGPGFDDAALAGALSRLDGGRNVRTRASSEAELCRMVAAAIAEGQVVGWLQGRMEWGPRALGARSDPLRSPPRRHEGHPQRRDQETRIVPPVRALRARRGGVEVVRSRRRQPFHEPGRAGPVVAARAGSRDHARRRQRAAANRRRFRATALSRPDFSVPRSDGDPDAAQHVIQRERTDRLHAGGGC